MARRRFLRLLIRPEREPNHQIRLIQDARLPVPAALRAGMKDDNLASERLAEIFRADSRQKKGGSRHPFCRLNLLSSSVCPLHRYYPGSITDR